MFITYLFFVILVFLMLGVIRILHTNGVRFTAVALIFIATVFFTVSSVYWTTDTAYRVDAIKSLEYGWLVPFYTTNHPMNNVWEAPSILWTDLFISIFINFCLLGGSIVVFTDILKRKKVLIKVFSFKFIFVFSVLIAVLFTSFIFMSAKIYEWENPGIDNPILLPLNAPVN